MEEYIVSARKYRPTTFSDVVGQEALTTTLKNAVHSGKLAHAYLFCGPRGVGKTTCARIFAKAINCQHPTADGEACNQCESCRAFNEQRSYSIFELDAASNNSVEHIKALMEQTRIPPQVGRYKVFIIDEVHMLSTAAFNAFLKTLEEPPAHVIFILATTEKHKILPTILSRCQIYDFERMSVADTIAHLRHVAEQEGIACPDEALAVIAEKADGGMRDALSIFDQVASFCQGNITYEKTIDNLGVLHADYYFKMVDMALGCKVSELMVLLGDILSRGFDASLVMSGFARHVRGVLMAKDQATLPLLEVSEQMRQRYGEQAQRCPAPFLYKALRLANQCDINYRQSSNKRLLVELTLIEVAQIMQPSDDDASAGRRPKRLKTLFTLMAKQPRQVKGAQQVAPAAAQSQSTTSPTSPLPASPVRGRSTAQMIGASPLPLSGEVGRGLSSSPTGEGREGTSTTYTTSRRPVTLRASGTQLGTSWSSLKASAAKPQGGSQGLSATLMAQMAGSPPPPPGEAGKGLPEANHEERTFTQADLELQWMAMCNRMPQQLSGIAARMKNMTPTITRHPNVEVVVENQIMLDQMQPIKGSIQSTLQLYLHNKQIALAMRLAERHEQQPALTRREQYEHMTQQNPSIERLRKLLDLELA